MAFGVSVNSSIIHTLSRFWLFAVTNFWFNPFNRYSSIYNFNLLFFQTLYSYNHIVPGLTAGSFFFSCISLEISSRLQFCEKSWANTLLSIDYELLFPVHKTSGLPILVLLVSKSVSFLIEYIWFITLSHSVSPPSEL